MLPFYSVLVKPHLEYCVQFWCPQHEKDMELLEKSKGGHKVGIRGLEHLTCRELPAPSRICRGLQGKQWDSSPGSGVAG